MDLNKEFENWLYHLQENWSVKESINSNKSFYLKFGKYLVGRIEYYKKIKADFGNTRRPKCGNCFNDPCTCFESMQKIKNKLRSGRPINLLPDMPLLKKDKDREAFINMWCDLKPSKDLSKCLYCQKESCTCDRGFHVLYVGDMDPEKLRGTRPDMMYLRDRNGRIIDPDLGELNHMDAEQVKKLFESCKPKANIPSFGIAIIYGTGGEDALYDFENFGNRLGMRGKDLKHAYLLSDDEFFKNCEKFAEYYKPLIKEKMSKEKYVYKSADTGEFVSKEFADDNPSTTYRYKLESKEEGLPQLEKGWDYYKRKGLSEMRPYNPAEVMSDTISISDEDKAAGSPKLGDMIARNPKNHKDMWLVAAKYFNDNLEKSTDEIAKKSFGNTTASGAKVNVPDIVFWGEGDQWRLLGKASSKKEEWMKYTKAMQTPIGCIIQVTTQQYGNVAEAVTFVPGVEIKEKEEGGIVVSRSLVRMINNI